VLHATIREFLLEFVSSFFQSLAGGLDIVLVLELATSNRVRPSTTKFTTYNTDAGVTKATVRLCIAVVDLVLRVVLRPIVVGELDESLSVGYMFPVGYRARAIVTQEVQVKLCLGKFCLLDDLHAQELVELDLNEKALSVRCLVWVSSKALNLPDSFGSFTRILKLVVSVPCLASSEPSRLLHGVVELVVLGLGSCCHCCE
jgi:hypothetical protein